MKLTIAIDDISIPLPPMQSPDIRQLVLEEVIELAARHGVEDIKLYDGQLAPPPDDRRRDRARGRRARLPLVLPEGPHATTTPRTATTSSTSGKTDQGEEVELNKRAMESDLLIYVNINLVAMDGGHKSVPVGLASYRSVKHHHNVHTMLHSQVVHGPAARAAARSTTRASGWATC